MVFEMMRRIKDGDSLCLYGVRGRGKQEIATRLWEFLNKHTIGFSEHIFFCILN